MSPLPKNLIHALVLRASENSSVAVRHKQDGNWVELSWNGLLEQVKFLSAAMVAAGVKAGDRVALFAQTSLKWVIVDLAINASQAVTVPIYASSTSDEALHILKDSEASWVFVDHDLPEQGSLGRLSKIRACQGDCLFLRKVVTFEGSKLETNEESLVTLLSRGQAVHESNTSAFETRVDRVSSDDLSHLIYTSGTTGAPKGVMLTHHNWLAQAEGVTQFGVMRPDDAVMLFLPLAHSFAQVTKAVWLRAGFELQIAESIDKLLSNLKEARPTILPSVPRVFEKIYASVLSTAVSSGGIKGLLGKWAFREFEKWVEEKKTGQTKESLSWKWAKQLVFSKIRRTIEEKLGGRLRLFVSGGAPLSNKVAYFFDALGFTVLEGYGLTETAAASSINLPGRNRIGTVGFPVPRTEVRIAEEGEICIRGPGVMRGYFKNPQATAEVISSDGWFRTGDIGHLDEEGYLHITDRKKDIIVTAGGKNIAPQNIENLLKSHAIISQAMVYGDRRNFLTVLICVSEEAARACFQQAEEPTGDYSRMVAHPIVSEKVRLAIESVNQTLPPYSTLKKFALADHDFSQATGELTPTLKLKRKVCAQKYKSLLDSLYSEVME